VLYVDGYPRYEYRFLRDSLLRFTNVEVQCLQLDASPEFIQDSTEGVPALTRFPYDPLRNVLLDYHVIIFGDVHPADLGPNSDVYLQQVKEFVEAGGGFLMQAGQRDAPREYVGTPIADILPVLIGDPEAEWSVVVDPGRPFRPVLERPRDPHEVVTLHPDLEVNRALWEQEGGLAPLTWYYPVAKPRATAEVLLSHPQSRNAHGPHVLLSTMYYPQGRTAFLSTDETWRWRFRYLETYREPFWRGLIRFLALNKLRRSDYRFDLSTDLAAYDIGARVAVTARVTGTDFKPLDAPSFDIELVRPDGRRETLTGEREEEGVFRASFVSSEPGPYRLWLEDPADPDGTTRCSTRPCCASWPPTPAAATRAWPTRPSCSTRWGTRCASGPSTSPSGRSCGPATRSCCCWSVCSRPSGSCASGGTWCDARPADDAPDAGGGRAARGGHDRPAAAAGRRALHGLGLDVGRRLDLRPRRPPGAGLRRAGLGRRASGAGGRRAGAGAG
jgi:uncharacterized membrane protein